MPYWPAPYIPLTSPNLLQFLQPELLQDHLTLADVELPEPGVILESIVADMEVSLHYRDADLYEER